MTDKELVRYFQLFSKYEKRFVPKGKHAIMINVSKYNIRWIYRNLRAKRVQFPEADDV